MDIAALMPKRVLPIASSLPADLQAVISTDMDALGRMLGGSRRKEDVALARLRPYLIIEQNVRALQGVADRSASAEQTLRRIKKSGDWRAVLPMVAGLIQSSPTGIPIAFYATKHEGFPVRIDPDAPAAIAFRYVKPEDKYPFLTVDLADRVKVGRGKVVGLVGLFDLKGNDEYHTSIRVSQSSFVQRYSQKTVDVLAKALATEGLERLWEQARAGKRRDPREYS
jgi:hypothetical protein